MQRQSRFARSRSCLFLSATKMKESIRQRHTVAEIETKDDGRPRWHVVCHDVEQASIERDALRFRRLGVVGVVDDDSMHRVGTASAKACSVLSVSAKSKYGWNPRSVHNILKKLSRKRIGPANIAKEIDRVAESAAPVNGCELPLREDSATHSMDRLISCLSRGLACEADCLSSKATCDRAESGFSSTGTAPTQLTATNKTN